MDLLPLYTKLARIDQDITQHKSTKKQLAYLGERRSVLRQVLDATIAGPETECEQLRGFSERLKDRLLDAMADPDAYPQSLVRAILDDFGEDLKRQFSQVQALVGQYKCGAVVIDNLGEQLSEIAKMKVLLFGRIETATKNGRIPNYELLINPWMLLIEVQNEAIALKAALDRAGESFAEFRQRFALESARYRMMRYGKEVSQLCDAMAAVTEDELRMDNKAWRSVYDELEVHVGHLRGMIEFAEVQYSKGIQDETALLNRVFIVGVVAQLAALFSITAYDLTANRVTALVLIFVSIVPPLILYYVVRFLYERLAARRTRKRLLKLDAIGDTRAANNTEQQNA